jgi:hypothetical protein
MAGGLLVTGWPGSRFGGTMVSMSTNDVVFENLEHDFPQRIIYRLIADGKLLGHIEGVVDGAERSADFPMTRMKCDNGHEPA